MDVLSVEIGNVKSGKPTNEYDLDIDDEINALVKADSNSSGLPLIVFEMVETKLSSTTSLEVSLLRTEINMGKSVVISSSVWIGLILETFKYFPLKFKPFSMIFLVSINTVSGIRFQRPVLEIFSSPAKCISVMSLGNILNNKFSEKTAREVSDKIPSTPFLLNEGLLNMSEISDPGIPNLANFYLNSSYPCSIKIE